MNITRHWQTVWRQSTIKNKNTGRELFQINGKISSKCLDIDEDWKQKQNKNCMSVLELSLHSPVLKSWETFAKQRKSFWYAGKEKKNTQRKTNREKETFYQIRERSAPLKAYSFSTFTFWHVFISSSSTEFCQVIWKSKESTIIIQCIQK